MDYPYLKKEGNRTDLIVDGKPFLALAGELHNSTSASAEYAGQFWEDLKSMNLNTVILGVSWELVEPEEDVFDFSLVGKLVRDAESHGLKLILLWFATWKNASSSYTPEWVQSDLSRFPRAESESGRKNAAISCFSQNCCERDANAFSRLMQYLRENDRNHTVIAVQVENESGVLGIRRDCSDEADRFFEQNIPETLSEYLLSRKGDLGPVLDRSVNWEKINGTWQEVFQSAAPEAFMCYYTARYIDKVAQAGKEKYPIPMYVNGWTSQCRNEPAGLHPSGGPISEMLDIWKCAAPHIDMFAGDLYLENFAEECAAYTRLAGNPLFIPEARKDKWVMAHAFYAIANHDALCFSPFGVEGIKEENKAPENQNIQSIFQTMTGGDTSDLLRKTYGILSSLTEIICRFRGSGKMKGILQGRLMEDAVVFSKYSFQVKYSNFIDQVSVPAGGFVLELGPDEFLTVGANFSLIPVPASGDFEQVEILSLEEGSFHGTEWVCDRRLNGDELHIAHTEEPKILKVKLMTF